VTSQAQLSTFHKKESRRWFETDLVFDDEGTSKQQLVRTCLDDAEVLQHVLVGDAFLRVQHVVNSRPVAARLREQRIHA